MAARPGQTDVPPDWYRQNVKIVADFTQMNKMVASFLVAGARSRSGTGSGRERKTRGVEDGALCSGDSLPGQAREG